MDERERPAQLVEVPQHRLRLAAEGVEAVLVEIGGGEARIVARQEAVRPVVEAFARHVHVVGIEHAVDEAGGHPAGAELR